MNPETSDAAELIVLRAEVARLRAENEGLRAAHNSFMSGGLHESESQMRAIVENLHDGLVITDLRDTILYANARMSEMTGYSNAELVGQNAPQLLVDAVHWPPCNARNQQRKQGESSTYELPLLRRDGSTRWMLINGSPLRNDKGEIVGTIGAHFDFTERKLDEVERARFAQRLQNSNRDLEIFAFAVSHDLKQPLRKIEVFSSRLKSQKNAQLSEQNQLYLDRIYRAARRMTSLINGLLAYSRVTSGHTPWGEVDLNQIAAEVMHDLELVVERAGADVQIGDLPRVRASALQMRQLLQNLIGNALDYRRPDVPLIVRVAGRVVGENYSLEVADNGRGFEPEQSAHIFEIFSRLNVAEDSEGSGVGLTICRAIVERHGGTLTAQSTPGQGATFRVLFPITPPDFAGENARGEAVDG